MKIAVIQIDICLQSYTKDFINILIEQGFFIDLYINKACDCELISSSGIACDIYIIDNNRLIRRLLPLSKEFSRLLAILRFKTSTIDFLTKLSIFLKMRSKSYNLIIGIEKKGLVISGWLSHKLRVPYAYYSLELYWEDHPNTIVFNRKLRCEEVFYNQKALFTIIQDTQRAQVLSYANKLDNQHDFCYLPVGVRGAVSNEKSSFFQDKFSLKATNILVLYFGNVSKDRNCEELVKIAEQFPEGTYLVLHGKYYGMENTNFGSRVLVSKDLVDENMIQKLISSCDIGLALYNNHYSNDRLTAFSSQKIAYYLQQGIPFISFRNESYEKLFSEFECGLMVNKILDIGEAIFKIIKNYEYYSKQALLAYEKYYNLDNQIPKIFKEVVKAVESIKSRILSD